MPTIRFQNLLLCPTHFTLSDIAAEPTAEPDPDAVPVLSSRDYSLLKGVARLCLSSNDPVGYVLANTLDRCRVVPPDAVPPTVAVLGARVVFRSEGQSPECRVLVMAQDDAQDGVTLAVSVPFGAAILGAAAGQALEVIGPDGRRIVLHLLAVEHDPVRRPATAMLPDHAKLRGIACTTRYSTVRHDLRPGAGTEDAHA